MVEFLRCAAINQAQAQPGIAFKNKQVEKDIISLYVI